MSKNIHKLCLIAVILTFVLSSYSSIEKSNNTILPSAYVNTNQSLLLDPIPTDEGESEGNSNINRITVLDEEFEAQTPEPNGSTASMLAYAEAYLELWQGEIDTLITDIPSLADEFASFEAKLNTELDALANEHSAGDSAPYGSAVSYELVLYKANALRDWFIEYYS